MATKRTLRAVKATKKPLINSVQTAFEHGSRLDLALQMGKRIAAVVDSETTSPRDLAALTRRLMEISAETQALRQENIKPVGGASAKVTERPFEGIAI